MNRRSGLIVTAGLLAALGSASTADAAGESFCRDYARAAVRQVHAVTDSGHCEWIVRQDSDAGRWSTDWRSHYNWCLGASYDRANSEREARHRAVDRCMRRGEDRDDRDRGDWDRGDHRRY